MNDAPADRYARYKRAIAGEPLPCAVIDLAAVDENVRRLLARVPAHTTVRIATKSVRCAALLRYLLQKSDRFRGLLCYTAREAAWLAEKGFDDLIVAYPSVQAADLAAVCTHPERIAIVVDSAVHVQAVAAAAKRRGVVVRVVIDVDPSLRAAAGRVHLGVRRSSLHTAEDVLALAGRVDAEPSLQLHGVMAYEAHVAGLPDKNPFAPLLDRPKRAFKVVARRQLRQLRQEIAAVLKDRVALFNGGGTATVDLAHDEPWLSEITIGSGFLASALFDYYEGLELVPAAAFAVQTTRAPEHGFVTVHGGGFIASGAPGPDRLPVPYLPPGLSLLRDEGAGEVQTGLRVDDGVALEIGDPVFFRHAKAGELAEHFNEYLLVRGEHVIERVHTYRGDGQVFG